MFEVYKAGTDDLLTIADAARGAERSRVFRVTIRGTESDAEHKLVWSCGALYPLTSDGDLRKSVLESVALDVELATDGYTAAPDRRSIMGRLVDELGMSGLEAHDTAVALTGMGLWYARLAPDEQAELERLAVADR